MIIKYLTEKKSKINQFDEFELHLFLTVLYFNKKVCVFDKNKSISDVFNYIFNNLSNNAIIFVDNLNVSGILIMENLKNEVNFAIDGVFENNEIYALKIYFKKKKITLKCFNKFCPIDVNNQSNLLNCQNYINYSKNENVPNFENIDFSTFNELNENNKKNYIFFFKQLTIYELETMHQVLSRIVSISYEINIKCLFRSYSISSLAANFFRKSFNICKIDFFNNFTNDQTFRPSYLGGRCEVFGNPYEKEKIFYYDFKGMYAQIMSTSFPFGNFIKKNNIDNIDKIGFYYVRVKSKHLDIPILPLHRNTDFLKKKLMFVNGEFEGLY